RRRCGKRAGLSRAGAESPCGPRTRIAADAVPRAIAPDGTRMSTSESPDRWAAGSTYEDFMGRWSRQLAPLFVSWLRVPDGVHWLDFGWGTGAMTRAGFKKASRAAGSW